MLREVKVRGPTCVGQWSWSSVFSKYDTFSLTASRPSQPPKSLRPIWSATVSLTSENTTGLFSVASLLHLQERSREKGILPPEALCLSISILTKVTWNFFYWVEQIFPEAERMSHFLGIQELLGENAVFPWNHPWLQISSPPPREPIHLLLMCLQLWVARKK